MFASAIRGFHLPFLRGVACILPAYLGTILNAIRTALDATLTDPHLKVVKESLLVDHFQVLPLQAYEPIGMWESEALSAGYKDMDRGLS